MKRTLVFHDLVFRESPKRSKKQRQVYNSRRDERHGKFICNNFTLSEVDPEDHQMVFGDFFDFGKADAKLNYKWKRVKSNMRLYRQYKMAVQNGELPVSTFCDFEPSYRKNKIFDVLSCGPVCSNFFAFLGTGDLISAAMAFVQKEEEDVHFVQRVKEELNPTYMSWKLQDAIGLRTSIEKAQNKSSTTFLNYLKADGMIKAKFERYLLNHHLFRKTVSEFQFMAAKVEKQLEYIFVRICELCGLDEDEGLSDQEQQKLIYMYNTAYKYHHLDEIVYKFVVLKELHENWNGYEESVIKKRYCVIVREMSTLAAKYGYDWEKVFEMCRPYHYFLQLQHYNY